MNWLSLHSPIGDLTVFEDYIHKTKTKALIALEWGWGSPSPEEPGPLLKEARSQLDAYFDGKKVEFKLPLAPTGTAYQKKVWASLQQIPYGTTCSYKDLSITLDTHARPIGGACRTNPIPLFIPCHRIIAQNNHLTGYSGGIEIKKALLNLEGCSVTG